MKKPIIKKEQFLKDVAHEVEMLKIHATAEQIERLNFDNFDPCYGESCIYGQMTGHCRNEEANRLMNVACIRVVHRDYQKGIEFKEATFKEIAPEINGEYKGQMFDKEKREGLYSFMSMIETYILLKNSKPENIIKYLKGEVDTLVL